jgi:ABC-2 type transport system permease protein
MNTPETNLSAAGAPVADTPPAIAVGRQASILNTLILLIRRELWEHRALWITPLVVVVLLSGATLFLPIHSIHFDPPTGNDTRDQFLLTRLVEMQVSISAPLFLISSIVLTFYLLDCLYTERKDRSILFWKSLPVSDATTVASKLLVALLVVPIGVYLLTIVESMLLAAILSVRTSFTQAGPDSFVWDTLIWLKVELSVLFVLIRTLLWYAPLAVYLLLVSAWARRTVFLWAILPPVIAVVGERITFGTFYLGNLIKYRMLGIPGSSTLESTIRAATSHAGVAPGPQSGPQFDIAQVGESLLNIDLWLGLAVAAAFAFVAVRIRRYRDDT